jgi:uncharacterized protein YbbC (DUF1343 family)
MKGLTTLVALVVLGGGAAAEAQKAPAVKVGLEVLAAEGGGLLKGRQVGLIAHAASVTADGRHSIDVLRAAGVNVVRIFSPERAVRVRGAAWDKVAHNLDGTPWSDRRQSAAQTWADVGTKLPVQGLFGDKAWLKVDDLKGMDALVFDLQDAGTRTFTITGLMVLGMEAAAAAGIDFVVLDRPNPLGGELVQGPVADGWGGRQTTLTTVAPGPLLPGLTVGEMARVVNARREGQGRLHVVPMKGWKRGMLWPDTGRAWPVPSPNLRTFGAAVAYGGVALVEATTASEGRGTESPFQLVGAPGLDGAPLVSAAAPGFTLTAATFTPHRSTAAANPKHSGAACQGVKVAVSQPRAARPYQLGIALLRALHGQGAVQWKSPTALDDLLGTRKVRAAIERGDSVGAIVAADAAEHDAFQKERLKALLY